jgi:hypothetical protein
VLASLSLEKLGLKHGGRLAPACPRLILAFRDCMCAGDDPSGSTGAEDKLRASILQGQVPLPGELLSC